jgi:hypothetical protein
MESMKRRRIGQRRGKKRRFCAWNEKREERGEETEGERRRPSADEGVEMFWSCCQPAGGGLMESSENRSRPVNGNEIHRADFHTWSKNKAKASRGPQLGQQFRSLG